MNTVVASSLDSIRFGKMLQHESIAVLPLLTPDRAPAYLTLAAAQAQGLLTIGEVSTGGVVAELNVVNRADLPVLLIDGEELAGAKQNRVANASILVPAGKQTAIPVSCTEQGRWGYRGSAEFAPSGNVLAHKARATKHRHVTESLARESRYASPASQTAVWNEIQEMQEKAAMRSETSAMRDVYASRETDIGAILESFPLCPGQTGLLVFVAGEPVGMDHVSRPDAYAVLHEKLLRAYVLDALLERPERAAEPDEKRATAFLAQALSATDQVFPSVGHGEEIRFQASGLTGSSLVWQDTAIHTALFATAANPPSAPGRMAGYRRRRETRE